MTRLIPSRNLPKLGSRITNATACWHRVWKGFCVIRDLAKIECVIPDRPLIRECYIGCHVGFALSVVRDSSFRQDYRITPYINYAYALLWKRTIRQTIDCLWESHVLSKFFSTFFLSLFEIRPKMSNFKNIFTTNTPWFGIHTPLPDPVGKYENYFLNR